MGPFGSASDAAEAVIPLAHQVRVGGQAGQLLSQQTADTVEKRGLSQVLLRQDPLDDAQAPGIFGGELGRSLG